MGWSLASRLRCCDSGADRPAGRACDTVFLLWAPAIGRRLALDPDHRRPGTIVSAARPSDRRSWRLDGLFIHWRYGVCGLSPKPLSVPSCMTLLSRLKLRTKLALLLGLSTLAVVVSIGAGASLMHGRMIDDRIDKVHAVVLAATGFAQSLQAQVDAHQISREQALATFRDQVHRVRFGAADDYLLIQTFDGMVVMHGGDPAREGKPTASKDASGRSAADLANDVLRGADGGVIWYLALKPGNAAPQAKVSYVARFAPWQMVFIAGAWIDDVDAAFRITLLRLSLIGGAILAVSLIGAWLVNRDISASLDGLRMAMD